MPDLRDNPGRYALETESGHRRPRGPNSTAWVVPATCSTIAATQCEYASPKAQPNFVVGAQVEAFGRVSQRSVMGTRGAGKNCLT